MTSNGTSNTRRWEIEKGALECEEEEEEEAEESKEEKEEEEEEGGEGRCKRQGTKLRREEEREEE